MLDSINESNRQLRSDIENDIAQSLSDMKSTINTLGEQAKDKESKLTKHDIAIEELRQDQNATMERVLKLESRSMSEN